MLATWFATAALGGAQAAGAQSLPSATTGNVNDDIVVLGKRRHFKMGLHVLLAGQATFLSNKDQYAPASSLRFLVVRHDEEARQKQIMLYLTDGKRELPIAVAADGTFQLPVAPAGHWNVEASLPPQQMTIEALVLSQGSSRYDYRMGDARLQCRANWAMLKSDASILAAPLFAMLDAAGSCTSRKVGIHMTGPVPISSVVLEEGSHQLSIDVSAGHRHYFSPLSGHYFVPVSDLTFSNEARVKIIPG